MKKGLAAGKTDQAPLKKQAYIHTYRQTDRQTDRQAIKGWVGSTEASVPDNNHYNTAEELFAKKVKRNPSFDVDTFSSMRAIGKFWRSKDRSMESKQNRNISSASFILRPGSLDITTPHPFSHFSTCETILLFYRSVTFLCFAISPRMVEKNILSFSCAVCPLLKYTTFRI